MLCLRFPIKLIKLMLPPCLLNAVDMSKKPTPPNKPLSELDPDYWDARRRFYQHLLKQSQKVL